MKCGQTSSFCLLPPLYALSWTIYYVLRTETPSFQMTVDMTGIQDRLKMRERELKDGIFSEAKMILRDSS